MPAQILSAIPKSGFQIAVDQIGAILLVELTAQKSLQPTVLTEDFLILRESLIPADSADSITINVYLTNADYGNMTQQTGGGLTYFNIDVTASGKAQPSSPGVAAVTGSIDATLRLHRYLSMIGYIFRSPYYRMLGYAPGTFGGVYVEKLFVQEPILKEDSDFTRVGRIVLGVRITEGTENPAGVPLEINNTQVFLDLTEKGYTFVFNNPQS